MENWRQLGIDFAADVQVRISAGDSWESIYQDLWQATPEQALAIRDAASHQDNNDQFLFWDGYLSRWD